ncbi:MAG: cytochrome C oxidase subunit IV family protein [Longimicrobiales bacterium]
MDVHEGTRTLEHGGPGERHTHHPSWKFYVMIGAVLTVITALEVAIFYIEALSSVLVPLLLVLSAAKFILVVMFFMHLRFDSKVLTGVFVAPLVLGVAVVVSLIILFKILPLI